MRRGQAVLGAACAHRPPGARDESAEIYAQRLTGSGVRGQKRICARSTTPTSAAASTVNTKSLICYGAHLERNESSDHSYRAIFRRVG